MARGLAEGPSAGGTKAFPSNARTLARPTGNCARSILGLKYAYMRDAILYDWLKMYGKHVA